MKKSKTALRLIVSLASVSAMMCGAFAAGAANARQQIQATLTPDVTVTLDGVPQTLKSADGTTVFPIIYNGSTYLPIRTVAGLTGLEVNWNQDTRTVVLGNAPNGKNLVDLYSLYHQVRSSQVQTSEGKSETISGINAANWLLMSVDWADSAGKKTIASYNLQGKHDTLTFKYYSDKNDTTLRVLGDNETVLGEYDVKAGEIAQEVKVNLLKTNQLTFEVTKLKNGPKSGTGTSVYIFDTYLDK